MDEKIGDKSMCRMCGAEIVFVGPYWDHIGENKPRHPATPIDLAAPFQPRHWITQLDPRELAQVRHAVNYAERHTAAGAPGHGQFLLLAKMAHLLDARPDGDPQLRIQKVSFDEQAQCWRDIATGVRVEVQ